MDVTVRYHHEPDGYWADSPDVEGLTAVGATLSEVRELVRDGLPFYLDTDEEIDLRESFDDLAHLVVVVDTHMKSDNFLQVYRSQSAGHVHIKKGMGHIRPITGTKAGLVDA